MAERDIPVLIVGAGPAGMTCALLLSRLGIASRIIERRSSPQTAPAAHVVNARTLEIFRAAGLDMAALAAASAAPADAGRVLWMTTLAGEELGRLPFERQADDVLALTPTPLRNLSQHRLEPLLLAELRRCPHVDIAYGEQWESAEDDRGGVVSLVRTGGGDTRSWWRSRWLIGADGAASRIRTHLGIRPIGPDRLQSFIMIHFTANLRPLVAHRPGVLYWTTAPGATGTFVAHDIDSTWVYMHPWDPQREAISDYSDHACAAIVRRALGTDAYPFVIRTIRPWTMTAQVAERYRERRTFLVGDAAHRFPPTGGLGLNTGVQDAHNLIWKIGAVEAGWAPETLLDSYEAERRPVAQRNAEVSLHNAMRLAEVFQALPPNGTGDRGAGVSDTLRTAIANQAEHFDMLGLQLGFVYSAGALMPGENEATAAVEAVREYVPSARPGARVPHAWLARAGRRLSSLDVFAYDRFTLVSGPDGDTWDTTASAPVPLARLRIGHDIVDGDGHWLRLLGIDASGAVLVRPDQHVAWRARRAVADPVATLDRVLRIVVCAATAAAAPAVARCPRGAEVS